MWTVFIFVGSYPYKRGSTPPEHQLVFVDDALKGARDRYYSKKGAQPEAHGMANFEAETKEAVWELARRSGFVYSGDPRDSDVEHVCKKQATLVLEEQAIGPKGDGMTCAGKCKSFCPYVEPNQPNGTYICPECR